MKLAFSLLCENPARQTALTTFFREFFTHALKSHADIDWLIFAGPNQEIGIEDSRLQFVRSFPANDRMLPRLRADHLRVSPLARRLGAAGLLTVGFLPLNKRLPTFVTVNSLQHLSRANRVGGWRQWYRASIMRYSMARAELVITNSHFAASQLTRAYPRCRSKLVVSHEGTEPQYHPEKAPGETEALQRELGLQPGYLLWVSNFYHYKQAPLLIEAYAQLPAVARQQMPIIMVGGDWEGALADALATADRCGVRSQVRHLGWIDAKWLPPLYRHCRAFCLPSREETFGRCTTEAMSCGAPCLLHDIPVSHEISGGHALIVDFNHRPLVAHTLQRLFEDQSLQERLRREGLEQAAKFSFERMTRVRLDAIQHWFQTGTAPRQ